jgi:uncharacterized protein YjiS (DUF1127 family)
MRMKRIRHGHRRRRSPPRLIKEGQDRGELAKQSENQSNLVSDGNKVKKTLSDIGLTRKQSSVYQKIAGSLPYTCP